MAAKQLLFCLHVVASIAVSITEIRADNLLRGVIYVQPSYHYTNTLQMSLSQADSDFQKIGADGKQFVHLGLRVSWGDLMTHWNGTTSTPTWNETNCKRLGELEQLAGKHGMKLIFNCHLKEHVPTGISGILLAPNSTDTANVTSGGIYHSAFDDLIVHDEVREPIIKFHEKFASCMSPGKNVAYWKHAFESMYLFPTSSKTNTTAATNKFTQWAQKTNNSLSHWASRWGKSLTSWDDLSLPNASDKGNKAFLGDYWRFWLLGVLKSGEYGLSVGEIMAALQRGSGEAYQPTLGFKHWKAGNFMSLTDMTHEELIAAYDLPINLTALGMYCNGVDPTLPPNTACTPSTEAAKIALETYINDTKAVAPTNLPILIWETGASTRLQGESEQVAWASLVENMCVKHNILGYNWWQYVDWLPALKDLKNHINKDLCHFGMHYANGTAKAVWNYFPRPSI
eukprot:m.134121 g.134121  ORF g.134121 m.134121 type:complete len:455 (+) comp14689_c0_seq1:46-1410(+)